MSKVRAVAATIVFMLGASVSYAQSSDTSLRQPRTPFMGPSTLDPNTWTLQSASRLSRGSTPGISSSGTYGPGMMYVACWAEVPSNNTAYFSATFAAPTVNGIRKEFRQFVKTQYGPVTNLQCIGKYSEAGVNEQVEKWKDSARNKNAIVDT
jgi:hypothetical protein